MTYCNSIYDLNKSSLGEWQHDVKSVLEGCDSVRNITRLIFFIAPGSNVEYAHMRNYIMDAVDAKIKSPRPIVSIVAQRALDSGITLEIHRLLSDFQGAITEIASSEGHYLRIDGQGYKEIIIGGLCDKDISGSVSDQSTSVFDQVSEILQGEGMVWGNVVRQWNYIENIVAFSHGNQRYQDFNDVRTHYYEQSTWADGYPAATGIGMQYGGIMIDINAVLATDSNLRIIAIDSDLQTAAHIYSPQVLISNHTHKCSPKFERAKMIFDGSVGTTYISGTAAIRGEKSLGEMGVLLQTDNTMENIEHLISNQNGMCGNTNGVLKLLRVYLKDAADVKIIEPQMSRRYNSTPISYLLADICRDELLVEIEGFVTT